MTSTESASGVFLADAFTSPLPGRFPGALVKGPGLSFSHSGLDAREVMSRLQIVEEVADDSDPERVRRQVVLEDPDHGLQVTIDYAIYRAHNAAVYGAVLRNEGRRNVEHMKVLHSYDLAFSPLEQVGSPRLHTLGGGVTHYAYPPLAFRQQEWHLLGPTRVGIDSGPSGRSSNKDLPYFLIEDGDGQSGIFGGIAWSGLWHIDFIRHDEPEQVHYGHLGPHKSLAIEGGMDQVDLILQTGEAFHLPRVLLGFYEGSIHDGRNALRHFNSDWSPSFPPEVSAPPTQATPGGYICPTEMTTDPQCRAHAAANADIGVEFYVVENWFESLAQRPDTLGATGAARGSWLADPERFPDLEGFADFVRAQGMRFGLWTDMEVAHAESRVAREHPEWVLYLEGSAWGLLNLGLRPAQDWAIATYDRLIEDYGVEWIFYDNNIDPAPFWRAHEPPDRRGRLQHDYIRGVWRVWDQTRRRHPGVVLENCSSGGRRIDLGTLKRAHCHVVSDQFRHPESIRFQFSGANTVLPGDRLKSIICAGFQDYPDHGFQANFGGLLSISEGVEQWSPEQVSRARKHLEVYKTIRSYLSQDYYHLFAPPRSLAEWDGWQFHDPETDEGFVLLFRVQAPQSEACPLLHGLNPEEEYLFVDPYGGEEQTMPGSKLLDEGLPVELTPDGTRLLRYRPA